MRLLDLLPNDSWLASKSSGSSSFALLRRPDDRPVPSVSVADMRAHIAFLRAVHVHSTRDESSSLYVDGPPLRAAVGDYLAWLVEVSVARTARPGPSPGEILLTRAPTLPVAWCWHVHRLDPHAYVRDCADIDPAQRPEAAAMAQDLEAEAEAEGGREPQGVSARTQGPSASGQVAHGTAAGTDP